MTCIHIHNITDHSPVMKLTMLGLVLIMLAQYSGSRAPVSLLIMNPLDNMVDKQTDTR